MRSPACAACRTSRNVGRLALLRSRHAFRGAAPILARSAMMLRTVVVRTARHRRRGTAQPCSYGPCSGGLTATATCRGCMTPRHGPQLRADRLRPLVQNGAHPRQHAITTVTPLIAEAATRRTTVGHGQDARSITTGPCGQNWFVMKTFADAATPHAVREASLPGCTTGGTARPLCRSGAGSMGSRRPAGERPAGHPSGHRPVSFG